LVTHKTTVDGVCRGHKTLVNSRAADIYVHDGGQWKEAFHAEAKIVDPGALPVKPVSQTREASSAKPADPNVAAMAAAERAVWGVWQAHDAKKLANSTTREISFINVYGTYFATKADALKDWSATGCDVKTVEITDAVGKMLSPTVGLLRYVATPDGTCYGQKVGRVWGTSVYVKDGNAWKWTFGINVPARQ
jgi:hypothetical protein